MGENLCFIEALKSCLLAGTTVVASVRLQESSVEELAKGSDQTRWVRSVFGFVERKGENHADDTKYGTGNGKDLDMMNVDHRAHGHQAEGKIRLQNIHCWHRLRERIRDKRPCLIAWRQRG